MTHPSPLLRLHRVVLIAWSFLVIPLGWAPSLGACPIVTGILTRPGASQDSFSARVLEISQVTQELFKDPDFDRVEAARRAEQAMETWLDLYLHYYLAPPEGFQDHPHWRLVMDSITGPLRRIQEYARTGDYPRGHDQLRILQDSLTEFYGEPPQRTAAGFGPVFHSLETLKVIPAGGGVLQKERAARLLLLQERYAKWLQRFPNLTAPPEAFRSFRATMAELAEAVGGGDGSLSASLAEKLLASSKEMIREALVLEWSASPVSIFPGSPASVTVGEQK